jgi:hypothetical protein
VHFASFDLNYPIFDAHDLRLSVQVVARDNVYGVDPAQTSGRLEGDTFVVRSAGLSWAGGTQRADGKVVLRVRLDAPGRVSLRVKARANEPIRCVKILLRDLPAPLALVEEGGERAVGALGEVLAYPNRLGAPILLVRAGDATLALRAEDPEVREKRFAVATERVGALAGRGVVELIHEEAASRFARDLEAPPWIVARDLSRGALECEHAGFAAQAHGLRAWREREDVPGWARELRLALTLHGMHWTGRAFLDYPAMLEILRFVAARIDGRHVLAYLPGWEGRYYWQYGEYRPEPQLGGEIAFAVLCDEARRLGVHLMPMFGGNCVNAWLPRFERIDPRMYMKSATGNRFHGNQPDWDFSRAHDTGWQAWLNPGHIGWRDDLCAQIESLHQTFGFDGVFLDTIHVWINDPDHAVHPGIVSLVGRLRASIPGVLLAAEHDYDALLPLFGLFQRAYWGRDPSWTAPYALRIAHLCEGEPEGRTGVHEFGTWRMPGAGDPHAPARGYLPTLAFQDDTLERSREVVEAAIAAAAKSTPFGDA